MNLKHVAIVLAIIHAGFGDFLLWYRAFTGEDLLADTDAAVIAIICGLAMSWILFLLSAHYE